MSLLAEVGALWMEAVALRGAPPPLRPIHLVLDRCLLQDILVSFPSLVLFIITKPISHSCERFQCIIQLASFLIHE